MHFLIKPTLKRLPTSNAELILQVTKIRYRDQVPLPFLLLPCWEVAAPVLVALLPCLFRAQNLRVAEDLQLATDTLQKHTFSQIPRKQVVLRLKTKRKEKIEILSFYFGKI